MFLMEIIIDVNPEELLRIINEGMKEDRRPDEILDLDLINDDDIFKYVILPSAESAINKIEIEL